MPTVRRTRRPTQWAAALLIALLVIVASAAPAFAQHLRIYYPDIEQGSATLVVSPTGTGLLVDAGSELEATDDDVVLFLEDLIDQGVLSSLDFLVATHYDEDHIGRLDHVMAYGPVSPTLVTLDRGTFGGTPSTFAYSDYSFYAGQNGRTTLGPGDVIDLGGGVTVECVVVNAELPNATSVDLTGVSQFENNVSVGLVVRYGDFDAWIGGDLTGNPETGVADVETPASVFAGDVDVYTVNHHGSRTSSNADFLDALAPEVVINQSSASNSFGHPNSEVVDRILATLDSAGGTPVFLQQNPGNPTDTRSDDTLADGIADPDDVDEARGLPGSLLVISDGASYRVGGGAIAPLARLADAGSGPQGDFPPAVLLSAHGPVVPTAAQAVLVQAAVDDETSATVDLLWALDGVAQTPIAMTPSGGLYEATIPAQTDGTLVTYRVRATDTQTQVELGPERGYFAGTTPVGTIRDHDAAGLLLTRRLPARVEGNLTAEPGVFHPFVSQIYVQDDAGAGVQVFDRTILPLSRGERVAFVGRIEQFQGQAELNIGEDYGNFGYASLGAGSEPAPQLVTAAQIGEATEGSLVRIDGLTVVSGSIPETGSANLVVTDDGGTTLLTVRIDEDTDIPGANTPSGAFDLVGIASQFDPGYPFDFGYQVLPRGRADFLTEEVNLPPLLIHEIHADPANGPNGDANGDGSRDAADDEFLELANTGGSALDVSGWTISDGVGVRHVFPASTSIPAGEVAVVFGGGVPTGDFGSAAANGLVFTASTGTLALNNTGDTVSVHDDQGQLVQQVSYGSDYTSTLVQLSGVVGPGETFVVGGPDSTADNSNPTFDLAVDFVSDLQNSGSEGDGVALFAVRASQVTAATVPVDAVVYGPNNANGLIDETGAANAPEVGDAPAGESIERTSVGGSWQIQSSPTPGSSPL